MAYLVVGFVAFAAGFFVGLVWCGMGEMMKAQPGTDREGGE